MTINQARFTTYKSLSPVLRTQTTPIFSIHTTASKILLNIGDETYTSLLNSYFE